MYSFMQNARCVCQFLMKNESFNKLQCSFLVLNLIEVLFTVLSLLHSVDERTEVSDRDISCNFALLMPPKFYFLCGPLRK